MLSFASSFGTIAIAAQSHDHLRGWTYATPAGLSAWAEGWLAQASASIAVLKAVQGQRTVANTLVPYDNARNALAIVGNQTQVLSRAAGTAALRDAARDVMARAAAARTQLDLDPSVHTALAQLASTQEVQDAPPATGHYVRSALLIGKLAGADRDAATRQEVARLQARIDALTAEHASNVQKSTAVVRASASELSGLPADFVARHRAEADGSVIFTTAQPDVQPVLRFAQSAALRQRMFEAYENRAWPANASILSQILVARAEMAHLLRFKSYNELTVADQMIGSVEAIKVMLAKLDELSRPIAASEVSAVTAFACASEPQATSITAADAGYWTERYRQYQFGIDTQGLREFFPFVQVQQGVIDFATRFFQVRFSPIRDAVTWHPNVTVFDVHDARPASGDRLLGRIYLDMHPREGKDQWFATAPLNPGIGGRQLPEGVLLCNFPDPSEGDPALLNHTDVVTIFHEFGHLMHHILGGQGRWSAQGVFDMEEDFLEAPSQMLEEFTHNLEVLQRFARHYRTGAVLPADTIVKLANATAFGRAGWIRSQLQRADLALTVHDTSDGLVNLDGIFQAGVGKYSPYPSPVPIHSFAASVHLPAYGPNYYMYLLDKIIAIDFAGRFDKGDPTSGATPLEYRKTVLEPGGSRPAADLVQAFLHRPESIDALREWMEASIVRKRHAS